MNRLARALSTPESTPEEQRPAHQKHPLARMLLIGIVASVIGVLICLQIDWFPSAGSTQADQIDTLYDVLLIVSVPVFVLVMTVAIYCVIAFRAKPGEKGDGAHIHGNTKLEVVWVTIPFIIVTALAIYGWIVLDDIEAKKPNELVVNVTGEQFTWSFDYPGENVKSNELVLPVDRPVHFKIHAKDVLHSFWVPVFRMKQDAVPGIETNTRVTPDRGGQLPARLRRALRHRPRHDAPGGPGRSRGRVGGLGRRSAARAAPPRRRARARSRPAARSSSPRAATPATRSTTRTPPQPSGPT